MGLFDGIGSFIKNNSKGLNAGIGLATGLYGIYDQRQRNKDYINYLRAQETRNFQNQQSQVNYLRDQANNSALIGAQQENILRGALGQQLGYLNQASALYAPYAKVGRELLPHQKQIYLEGIKQLQALSSGMGMTPEKIAAINSSPVPIQNQPANLPAHLYGGR